MVLNKECISRPADLPAARGWERRKKGKKKFIPGTQPKARAGWPKRLRLVQTTLWADFAVIIAQLWSTIRSIFLWVDNFAFNYYSRPRFWEYCQIFKMSYLFRSLSVFTPRDALRYLYLRVSTQRFEPRGFIEPRRFQIIISHTTHISMAISANLGRDTEHNSTKLVRSHPLSQSHLGWHFRKLFQSSKLKTRTSLFTETWQKRRSSFELYGFENDTPSGIDCTKI